jgi:hypothetical protein
VLFAAQYVNVTVLVDHFVQTPSTFQYSYWNATTGITTRSIPGWTQAYCFYYGKGTFDVTNTTVVGNTTLDYQQVYPPSVVEFYHTNGSGASGITTGQESLGIDVDGSTNATISRITGTTGSNAVTLLDSTSITATRISGNGTDYKGFVTWGIDISGGSHVTLASVTATNESVGLVVNNTSQLDVTRINASGVTFGGTAGQINATTGLTVTDMHLLDGSVGLIINASTTVSLSNLWVEQNGYAGNISDSSGISVANLSVNQSAAGGFDFWVDHAVTVNHGTALGATSTVVNSLTDSGNARLQNLTADGQANAITATNSTGMTIENVQARNGSVGVSLTSVQWVNATGLLATNGSLGLLWNIGDHGRIRTVTAGLNCTGVDVSNATNVSVFGVAASESSLVFPYFLNPLTYLQYPVAGVALFNDSNASVSNVSTDEFPFAVWENYTNYSLIQNVTAWNGLFGIQVNASVVLTIARVFLQNNVWALTLNNVTRANVTGSTFEDSALLGANVTNDSNLHIYGNNFVANNNSSTAQVFSGLHKQVYVNNSTNTHFNSSFGLGNYWSDHPGTGAYVIVASPLVQDAEPQPAFLSNYVRFLAAGLLPLTQWGFLFSSVNYTTYAPLLYIPNWTLTPTSYPFTVHPAATYVPTPSSGTVVFTGADQNITIVFSHVVTFAVSGLPSGTVWQVTFNGTVERVTTGVAGTATLTLTVENGKFSYALAKIAGYWQSNLSASGSLTVAGANLTETLVYSPFTYSVTFQESGLAGGTAWSVTINGTRYNSTGGAIVVNLPNGSHDFVIGSVSGYSASISSGTVTVSGGAVTVSVTFTPPGLPVWAYAAIAVAALVAVLAIVLLWRRRRRARPRRRDDNVFG